MKEPLRISKENPFKVPGDYFGKLNDRIMSDIESVKPEKKSLVIRLSPFLRIAAGIAVLAVITLSSLYITGFFNRENVISDATKSSYNNVYLNDIDLAILEDNAANNVILGDVPEVSDNDIIDYLSSEEINIFDIYEQL